MAATRFKPSLVVVSVDYDYDLHEIGFSMRTLGRIASGRELVIEGDGFPCEDEVTPDYWAFNVGHPGRVAVNCEDGREVFDGNFVADEEVGIEIYVSQENGEPFVLKDGARLSDAETQALSEQYKRYFRKTPLWKRMLKAWGEEAERLLEKFTIQPSYRRRS